MANPPAPSSSPPAHVHEYQSPCTLHRSPPFGPAGPTASSSMPLTLCLHFAAPAPPGARPRVTDALVLVTSPCARRKRSLVQFRCPRIGVVAQPEPARGGECSNGSG